VVQKLAEQEEREARARRELEHERELAKVKSRFVSVVSHEFRTPLAIINAAAHLLGHYADRMSGEERVGQVEEIQNAVGRMAEMMEDLLVHGNLQSGNMKFTALRVDVEAFCRRLISETSNNPFAQCAIELVVGPGAHEAFLDEKILRCILGNLLSNAVKYSLPGQPVALEVDRVPGNAAFDADKRTSAGEHLQFKISDSGIGIPAADLSNVFQPFHRASNTGNRPGTGMGLAIVKQSVELHRGSIKVESEEGKGTTFWVWLPLALPNFAEGSPALPAEPKPPERGEQ
jgi:signal transduction histidine kinase